MTLRKLLNGPTIIFLCLGIFALAPPSAHARDRMNHGVQLVLPSRPDQYMLNARRQAALGLLPQAMATVEAALKRSNDPQYLFLRAQLHEANEQLTESEADYRAAWLTNKLEPKEIMHAAWEMNHCGQFKTCLEMCNQLVRSTDKDVAARAYFVRGRVKSSSKNFSEAIADYQESLKLAEDHLQVHMELGRLLLNAGKYQEAVKNYTRVIELATVKEQQKVADARRWRAEALGKLGKKQEAIVDLTEAIKIAPMQSENLSKRAEMYKSMGLKDKAEADERKAREIQDSINF